MARSELLLQLVRAASQGDEAKLRRSVEEIASEERSKQHHILAESLLDAMGDSRPRKSSLRLERVDDSEVSRYLTYITPEKRFDDLVISDEISGALQNLVREQSNSSKLKSFGLDPRNRVLLVGPPGNGKTSIAEALAFALMVPLLVVRYEGLIDSLLGETASRLEKLFDFVRSTQCVLFFDEIDVLAKERADHHEAGEIKRVVSSLLLQVDKLPSYCVIVTATNHPELLDRAVWRRFQLRLPVDAPDVEGRRKWQQLFEEKWATRIPLSSEELGDQLCKKSYAELEEFGLELMRRSILTTGSPKPSRRIVQDVLRETEGQVSIEDKVSRNG